MNLPKVFRLARYEILVEFRRKGFWLSAAFIPIMIWGWAAIQFGVARYAISSAADSAIKPSENPPGVVDDTGRLSTPGEVCSSPADRLLSRFRQMIKNRTLFPRSLPNVICYGTIAEAQQAVRSGKLQTFIHIPRDYVATGALESYGRPADGTVQFRNYELTSYFHEALIRTSGLPADLTARLLDPTPNVLVFELSPQGEFLPRKGKSVLEIFDLLRIFQFSANWYVVPLAIVLFLSFSAGAQSTRTERASHLIEAVLSSITATEYLLGKILSGIATSLTQLVVTGGLLISPLFASSKARGAADLVTHFLLPEHTQFYVFAPIFSILGCVMMGTLGAGVGMMSKPDDPKKAGLIGSLLPLGIMGGMYALPFIPEGPVKTVLSYLPPTSVPFVIPKLAMGEAETLTVLPALVLLVLGVYLTLRVSAKLMRVSLALDAVPLRYFFTKRPMPKRESVEPSMLHVGL